MKAVLIGTDHRLQSSVAQNEERVWVPRSGTRYRKLISYCLNRLGATAILEEAHVLQESVAPTIASLIAKEQGITWQSMSIGEINLNDLITDPPISEAQRGGIEPEPLAITYNLSMHGLREHHMYTAIIESLRAHNCVLGIVGFAHLGVLARMLENATVQVRPLLFTYPLVVDETRG